MASLAPDASVEDIQDEILFTRVLLGSLPPAATPENEERRRELTLQIEEFERLLQSKQGTMAPGSATAQTGTSASGNPIQSTATPGPVHTMQDYDFGGSDSETASLPSLDHGYNGSRSVLSSAKTGSGSSTDQTSSGSSPFVQDLANRPKRQRTEFEEEIEAYGRFSKNRKQDFANTGVSTPSSDSSFDYADIDADVLEMFAGVDNVDWRKIRKQQKKEEVEVRRRAEQERKDAELARLLSSQDEMLPPGSSSQLPKAQSYLGRNDLKIHKPIPLVRSQSETNDSGKYRMSDHMLSQSSTDPRIKAEHGQPATSSNRTRDWVDLSNEDEDMIDVAPPGQSGQTVVTGPNSMDTNNLLPPRPTFGYTSNMYQPSPAVVYGGQPVNDPKPEGWGQYTSNILNRMGEFGTSFAQRTVDFLDGTRGMPPAHHTPTVPSSSTQMPRLMDYGRAVPSNGHLYDVINDPRFNIDREDEDMYGNYYDRYNMIANDPTKTLEEIKALLENIRPDDEIRPEDREGTPEGMKYNLMEHQKLGLTWLKSMEEGSNKGGILADDMGLGKTIQALALILARPPDNNMCKTTLIVAPVALMRQWEREIQTKINRSHQLSTYLYHGARKNVTWEKLRTYDIVLTTYGTIAAELRRSEAWGFKRRGNPGIENREPGPTLPLLGDSSIWYRAIMDEAQCIKNHNTRQALAAFELKAKTRFCLTGTPMMNNVGELHSLLKFLRIKPYDDSREFSMHFTRPLKSMSERARDRAMKKLQALLKAVMLRRTKKSQIDGRSILDLPERTTVVNHAVFSDDEQAFYRALETQSQLQFNRYLRAGTMGRNYSNILVLLLRLRQACCHPHLIQDQSVAANVEVSAKDMLEVAKELKPEVVTRILQLEAFECPVCYDAVENPAIFIPCGHDTCSECYAKISDPAHAIQQGLDDGAAQIKCPTCRGKVTPSKVIDYNAFKKVHKPDPSEQVQPEGDNEELDSDSDSDASEDEEEDEGDETLDGFIVNDEDPIDTDDETADELDADGDYGKGKNPAGNSSARRKTTKVAKEGKKSKKSKKSKKGRKGKGREKESKASKKTLAQLRVEGMRNIKARRRYMRRLERDWEPSAKVDKCCEILADIQARGDEKTIVFSQFTSLLDLLEIPVSQRGWGFRRYDGSMSATQRHDAVLKFTDDPRCRILLVSLKAGNAGLNLVAASQVIILDPFWNPFIEDQAIDRAHRIGQLRPVKVHRLLVQNTVEDRIIELQEKKRALIEAAMDETASRDIARLGERELRYLFGTNPEY